VEATIAEVIAVGTELLIGQMLNAQGPRRVARLVVAGARA
jgi:molybdopterin-biosynthesis enzyme MoeA-like protein